MRQRQKRALLILVGILVSGVALAVFIQRSQGRWRDVWTYCREANSLYLMAAVGLIAVLYFFRVVRWRLFLRPIKGVTALSAASATCIGFMANNTLPVRMGELIRPYLLHKKEGVRFGHALATVGLARVFDLIGLSILLFITWVLLPAELPPQAERVWLAGLALVLLAVVMTCMLIGLALFPRPFLALSEKTTRLLPTAWQGAANGFLRSIAEAMGSLKDWKGLVLGVGYSAGLWIAQGLSNYMLCLALGLNIGLGGAFLAALAVSAAVAVPQAPGYVGTFHLAASLAAESFHVGAAEATAFALLLWLVNIVPITVVGLGFLWYEGLSLRKLRTASKQMAVERGTAD